MQLERPSERLFRSFQQSMLEWDGAHQDGAGIRDAALWRPKADSLDG